MIICLVNARKEADKENSPRVQRHSTNFAIDFHVCGEMMNNMYWHYTSVHSKTPYICII